MKSFPSSLCRLKCCFKLSSSFSQLSQSGRGHLMRGPLSSKCRRTCFSKTALSLIFLPQTWHILAALRCCMLMWTCIWYSVAKLKENMVLNNHGFFKKWNTYALCLGHCGQINFRSFTGTWDPLCSSSKLRREKRLPQSSHWKSHSSSGTWCTSQWARSTLELAKTFPQSLHL